MHRRCSSVKHPIEDMDSFPKGRAKKVKDTEGAILEVSLKFSMQLSQLLIVWRLRLDRFMKVALVIQHVNQLVQV